MDPDDPDLIDQACPLAPSRTVDPFAARIALASEDTNLEPFKIP